MEELMNFGCFLAEEERSEIVSVVGWTMAGRKLGPSSSGPACWEPVRFAVPF